MSVINRRDELTVLDGEGKELRHIQLGETVRFANFRDGGETIVLLTVDQKLRRMRVEGD